MTRTNFINYLISCIFLLSISGCNSEKQIDEEDNIPATIKNDLLKRHPSAHITSFHNYSDGVFDINFTDGEQNEASIHYKNGEWKLTYTNLKNFEQLPLQVQNTFKNSQYRNAHLINIHKTERVGIEQDMYTLYFKYPWKDVKDLVHYVFINGDGLFLKTLTSTPPDQTYFVDLPSIYSEFIKEKYKDAEIKGYVYNNGYQEYIILHQDTLKYVLFYGVVTTNNDFWVRTTYELSKNTQIPDNIRNKLQEIYPNFPYTNLYYIESNEGNAYSFINKDDDRESGYIIGEDVGITEQEK